MSDFLSQLLTSDENTRLTPGKDISSNELLMNSIDSPDLQIHPLSSIPEGIFMIQKDDDEAEVPSPDSEESSFEFDYSILPPSLQFTLGQWIFQTIDARWV